MGLFSGKTKKDFGSAIEWLIETNISKDAREKVHRDRMATKIMKAIRKHDTYMGYKWRRDKNTKIAFIGKDSVANFIIENVTDEASWPKDYIDKFKMKKEKE